MATVNKNNYHLGTEADFKEFETPKFCTKLLDEFFKWKRKSTNRAEFIEVEGRYFKVSHISMKKNSFFHSRGFSFYFMEKGKRSLIRISDHWSKSVGNPRSRKLNCAQIASCYWKIGEAQKLDYKVPSENFSSVFLSGICSFASFKIRGT